MSWRTAKRRGEIFSRMAVKSFLCKAMEDKKTGTSWKKSCRGAVEREVKVTRKCKWRASGIK